MRQLVKSIKEIKNNRVTFQSKIQQNHYKLNQSVERGTKVCEKKRL